MIYVLLLPIMYLSLSFNFVYLYLRLQWNARYLILNDFLLCFYEKLKRMTFKKGWFRLKIEGIKKDIWLSFSLSVLIFFIFVVYWNNNIKNVNFFVYEHFLTFLNGLIFKVNKVQSEHISFIMKLILLFYSKRD